MLDTLSTFSSLTDVLHALSQALLVPDIILLLLFAGYALFCIGSILMEFFTERRNFKVTMPKFLAALMAAEEGEIPEVIRGSGLLNRQKTALLTVYDYRTLPGDAMLALIRRTVNAEETHYARITGRNNTAAKVSPMLGLMGTLIPLGPGVAALGQADPTVLSSSLLVAFDTTVAGLAVAAVCMIVGKIRSNWYGDYLSALDSGMATLLQKIEDMRASGVLEATEPTNYAFIFEQGLKKGASSGTGEARGTGEASGTVIAGEEDAGKTGRVGNEGAAAERTGEAPGSAATTPSRTASLSSAAPVATGAGYRTTGVSGGAVSAGSRTQASGSPASYSTGSQLSGTQDSGSRRVGSQNSGTQYDSSRYGSAQSSSSQNNGSLSSGSQNSGFAHGGGQSYGTRAADSQPLATRDSAVRASEVRLQGFQIAGAQNVSAQRAGSVSPTGVSFSASPSGAAAKHDAGASSTWAASSAAGHAAGSASSVSDTSAEGRTESSGRTSYGRSSDGEGEA